MTNMIVTFTNWKNENTEIKVCNCFFEKEAIERACAGKERYVNGAEKLQLGQVTAVREEAK